MSVVPPHPHVILDELRASLAKLRARADLEPKSEAYSAAVAAVETAIAKLEEVTRKAP